MNTIKRKLAIDRRGTMKEFSFEEIQIAGRSVFVRKDLLLDGLPPKQLQALTSFLMSEEVQNDLMDFPVEAVLVNRIYENSDDYRMRPFGTDYWIR